MDPRFVQMIHVLCSDCSILGLHTLCVDGCFRSCELLLHYNEESRITVGRAFFNDFIQQNFVEKIKHGRGATLL